MRMTRSFILLCLLIGGGLPGMLSAQKGPVSAGGEATGAKGTISYSIGQLDYITTTGTQGSLTAGIQQPYLIQVATGIENTQITLACIAYPNPASTNLTLKIEVLQISDLYYALYDLQGKLLKKEKISNSETSISLMGLPDAGYLLSVFNDIRPLKSFRIIKNQ
jgi:hypothetical protein